MYKFITLLLNFINPLEHHPNDHRPTLQNKILPPKYPQKSIKYIDIGIFPLLELSTINFGFSITICKFTEF
jgi:hypothetical protein